jgi:uncharacterized protein (DUF433 family)
MRRMRISVALIVNLVANRMTQQETAGEYPPSELEDTQRAPDWAAWATEETIYIPAVAPA